MVLMRKHSGICKTSFMVGLDLDLLVRSGSAAHSTPATDWPSFDNSEFEVQSRKKPSFLSNDARGPQSLYLRMT